MRGEYIPCSYVGTLHATPLPTPPYKGMFFLIMPKGCGECGERGKYEQIISIFLIFLNIWTTLSNNSVSVVSPRNDNSNIAVVASLQDNP